MNTNVNMTNQEYSDFVDTKIKKSTLGKNIFFGSTEDYVKMKEIKMI